MAEYSRSVCRWNQLCVCSRELRNRLHSIGVSVRAVRPESKIETEIVTANSRSSRPSTPLRNRIGRKTATRDTVIEMMVKPTSRAPSSAACLLDLPISRWRTMFSIITMASSTTKPTDRVIPIMENRSTE
jgi:hypothetical protein